MKTVETVNLIVYMFISWGNEAKMMTISCSRYAKIYIYTYAKIYCIKIVENT